MLSGLPNDIDQFDTKALGELLERFDTDVGDRSVFDLVDKLAREPAKVGQLPRAQLPTFPTCFDIFFERHKYLSTVSEYCRQEYCVKYYCPRFELPSLAVSYNTQGMRNLAESLKKARISKGLEPRALAKAANVSPEYVYKIENGEITNAGVEKLNDLAQALGVPLSSLIEDATDRPREAFDAPAYIPFDIPVVGLSKAGRGGFFDDEGHPVGEGFKKIHRPEWVKDENAYAVLVDGDSMEPAIEKGCIAIAAPGHEIQTGNKVIARLNTEEVMLKKVRLQGDLIILESLNQKYPPIALKKKEVLWMHKVVAIKLP